MSEPDLPDSLICASVRYLSLSDQMPKTGICSLGTLSELFVLAYRCTVIFALYQPKPANFDISGALMLQPGFMFKWRGADSSVVCRNFDVEGFNARHHISQHLQPQGHDACGPESKSHVWLSEQAMSHIITCFECTILGHVLDLLIHNGFRLRGHHVPPQRPVVRLQQRPGLWI